MSRRFGLNQNKWNVKTKREFAKQYLCKKIIQQWVRFEPKQAE